MIKSLRVVLVAVLFSMLAAPAARAITYMVPTDAEMIRLSDDIVVVTAVGSQVERTSHAGIVTRYTMRIEEVLKGDRARGQDFVLTELGGQLGDVADEVPGRPEYVTGRRYLVFTEADSVGDPITFGFALGQFALEGSEGVSVAVRIGIYGFDKNFDSYVEPMRDTAGFKRYIRDLLQGQNAEPSYFTTRVAVPNFVKINATFTPASYVTNPTLNWRWQTPSYSFVKSGQQAGASGDAAVATALSEWNFTNSDINLQDAGRDDTETCSICNGSNFDGVNVVKFNDPANVPSGAVGFARFGGGGTHQFAGQTFTNLIEGDVMVTGGSFAQCVLDSIVTHEIGHTLGFRHSEEGKSGYTCGVTAECTSDAVMNFSVGCTSGALRTYDNNAASTVYGGGPTCTPVSITTEPVDRNVAVGTPTSLSVVAAGSAPISYQWYFGNASNTSNPVGGATSSSINITPTSAGSGNYWVRVTNCSGTNTDDSRTATVTATCTNPAISGISPNVTITGGQSTQLQVSTTGSATTFQWYIGTPTNRTQPTGSNSSVLTVSPSTTTTYWVEVSGACGSPVQSSAVTVTVVPCADITVDTPTATPGNAPGKYTLFVGATSSAGPLTFTWFRGGTPGFENTATSLGTGQSREVTVTGTGTTNFWARVQNGCGRVAYSSVIPLAACTLPTITTQPTDKTVNSNQSAVLSIAVSAGATVKWFRGTVGDTTTQIGTGTSVNTPPLTVNTQFWAEVRNGSCGPIFSRQVTVTVQQLAELITLLNNRFFVQVRYINQFENPPREGKLLGRSLYSSSTSETAIFTFGDPLVVELMVRLSDARPFDNKIHLYLGGLSDVEFYIIVTDSLTGVIKEYHKEKNKLLGEIDRTSFPAAASLQDGLDSLRNATTVFPSPNAEVSTIRLLNNRFEVRMRFRNQFSNPVGVGYMNVRSIASSSTTETAVFFFDENSGSVEWMVRFSDARPFAQRIDFFHGGLSDVEYTIEVTDTLKGIFREYSKPPFSLAGQVDRVSFTP